MTLKNSEAPNTSANPSKAKLQAMVLATNLESGKTLYVPNRFGSVTMAPNSAYELAKRYREDVIAGIGWTYTVQLIKTAL